MIILRYLFEKKVFANFNFEDLNLDVFCPQGVNLEDASTTCQSDKEMTVEKFPVIMGSNKKGIHSGYHSDLESVIPEDERQMMVKEALPKEITSNPDDLFFNIFQQLK